MNDDQKKATYEGFIRVSKIAAIIIAVVLLLMAAFLL